MPSFFGGFTALGLRLILPASFRCSFRLFPFYAPLTDFFAFLCASRSAAGGLTGILYLHRLTRFCFGCNIAGLAAPPGRSELLLPLFVQSIAQRHRFTCHMTFFSQHTVSRKMKTEKSLVSQRFEALFTNSFCPITQIKRQLPAHADSCLVCKTRMDSYLRFITSLTFSMMWRPMSLEASTVCAPMWGLMTKLSQEKSGLWNSSLPLRPLPASSFSMTSAA